MSESDDYGNDMSEHRQRRLDEHTLDSLLDGQTPTDRQDLEPLARLTRGVKAVYRDGEVPTVSPLLASVFEDGLEQAPELAATPAATAGLPRRKRVLSAIATFVGTAAGKVVVGTAVAAASVGGAQATGVIDLPVLPDRPPAAESQNDEELDTLDEEGLDGENGEDGEDGGFERSEDSQAPESLTDPGVDGQSVSEDARQQGDRTPQERREFGKRVSDEAIEGTPAEDRVPEDRGREAGEEHRENAGAEDDDEPGTQGDDRQPEQAGAQGDAGAPENPGPPEGVETDDTEDEEEDEEEEDEEDDDGPPEGVGSQGDAGARAGSDS